MQDLLIFEAGRTRRRDFLQLLKLDAAISMPICIMSGRWSSLLLTTPILCIFVAASYWRKLLVPWGCFLPGSTPCVLVSAQVGLREPVVPAQVVFVEDGPHHSESHRQNR